MTERQSSLQAQSAAARNIGARCMAPIGTALWLMLLISLGAFATQEATAQNSSLLPSSPMLGRSGDSLPRALLPSGGGASSVGAYGDFLDPDIAFVPTLKVVDTDTVRVRWDIADGYYLYGDKFSFKVLENEGIRVGEPSLPPGEIKEDEFFGSVEVFYANVEADLVLLRSADSATELTLVVGYQGCADAGLCYPPLEKTLPVALPKIGSTGSDGPAAPGTAAASILSGSAPSGSLAMSEQDFIARSMATNALWLTVLSFYGFGLLLAFTPCVLPMVPILSSIIAGHGTRISTRRGFLLSLTFVLAMATAYTAAGVVAGVTGSNLQAAFQEPWVLIAFSMVFVLLSLSMFGLYDLQLPASWQSRLTALSNEQRRGHYLGVAAMGLLAALIVGPCVAAPLAGALIYIGKTGDGFLGGVALFTMSLGMGTPLLLLGASAGKLLPRAGTWMVKVKAGFGFLLLGMAVYLLERLIPGWVALFLWAALLIYAAIYVGALDTLTEDAGGWRRLAKGTGLIMLAYGLLLMVGAAGGSDDVFRPLRGIGLIANGQSESPGLPFQPVKGSDQLDAQLQRAKVEGRPVMLDFYADWCVSCKELEKYTFSDPRVQAALAGTTLLQTDVTANDAQDQALLKQLGLYGPPAVLFFSPDGQERAAYRLVGFMDAEQFLQHARGALAYQSAQLGS